jgi:hypothetical protein
VSTCIVRSDHAGLWLSAPFSPEFTAALKSELPKAARRWSKLKRTWRIRAEWSDAALAICHRFYAVEYQEQNPP